MNSILLFENFHWFTLGAFVMILGYIIFQYINVKQSEYLIFAINIVFVLLGTGGSYYFATRYDTAFDQMMLRLLNTSAHVCSFIVNLILMQKLLDLKKFFPALNRIVVILIASLSIYVIIDIWLSINHRYYSGIQFLSYNTVRVVLIIFSLTSTAFIFRKCDLSGKYFLIGLLGYVLFGATATIFQVFDLLPETYSQIPAYCFRTGVLIQILFFSLGVGKKIKIHNQQQALLKQLLQEQVFRNELEKEKAILHERSRISRDMHDDLGTGLSKIALLSEVLKQQSADEPSRISLEKISTSAKEALETISEIVWSLNPKNDTLENLTSYLRKYTVEYFEPTGINCKVKLPEKIPYIMLTGIQRRNIYLSVKEALHNIVKHSQARNARLTFVNDLKSFQINIEDDGKGLNVARTTSWGNGLVNMKKRVEENGGKFELENKIGTTVRITFPIQDTPKG